MIDWSLYFYFTITSAAFLLSIVGLLLTVIMPGFEHWRKRFFQNYFLVLMLAGLSGLLELSMPHLNCPRTVFILLLCVESVLLSLTLPMLTVYLLHYSDENLRTSKLFHTVLGLYAVYFLLLIISLFSSDNAFLYVTPDNRYYRCPLYPLSMLPMFLTSILNLSWVIQHRKQFSHKTFISFLIATLPMTAALLVLMFAEVYPLVDISIVLSALAMYSLLLSEQIEQDMRYQREIANQRASIMVLEMRPHFIYNTMTSIYCLCNQDPEKAKQVILDFTTYLRRNFSAIASSEPIPFTAELEHTSAYLAVEQAQYEDSLFVDYDTPHTMFRVPALTLQPIVENAIKHGRDPYAGPFHISIRTRKTDSGSEIIVADNGRGFAPVDNDEPHIALKNIQQRLEIMCGGSLTVTPNEGGGTVVTVTIPDRPAE